MRPPEPEPAAATAISLLLAPLSVGDIVLPNRVVMAPMTTRYAAPDGSVTEQLIRHYEARARGGVGLVMVELASPVASGAHRRRELGVHDDRFIPGLRRLTDRIHAHGAVCGIQIGHAGAHARPDVTGAVAVAPSDVAHVVRERDQRRVEPRPLDVGEIEELVDAHAACVERCRRAGFDIVELQAGHDYLLAQFLSPLDNLRTDAYGGSLDSRARFLLEIIDACRERAGGALSVRLSADEFAPGGTTLEDSKVLAQMLEVAGVDLVDVSAGSARSRPIPWLITTPMAYPAGLFVPLAKEIKEAVGVPVAVAGRLHDPSAAEAVVRDGCADLVVLGRALLADALWAHWVRAGRPRRIRPCIACNTCVDHLRSGREVRCLVNPETGMESPAPRPARNGSAVVVGGGPAGMTAAATLAEGGLEVVLLERVDRLGGRLRAIPLAPRFQVVETAPEPFERLVRFLRDELDRTGVQVRTGRRAPFREVVSLHPRAVVVATGARYPLPGLLHLLKLGPARRLAAAPRLHKLFFRLLRQRHDRLPQRLRGAGIDVVVVVGDRSGTRGVEAAIHGAHRQACELLERS